MPLSQCSANVNMHNHEGSTALVIAAENGHVEVVKLLLEEDADVNVIADGGLTALIIGKSNF